MRAKKWIILIPVLCAAVYFSWGLLNIWANNNILKYIDSFAPVVYDDTRLVPKMSEDGHYEISADRDIKVMHITDIHIGGGIWSLKNDRKSVYELISMLQKEAPDLVILGGDNTYAVPGIGFNGGFTCNNERTARSVIHIFEHEKVYFSTVFGNHDTESYDTATRQEIGNLYMKPEYEYCIFNQEYCDEDADTVPSVSNQIIELKDGSGKITKLLVLLDTNAYVDDKFLSAIFMKYDVIHDKQIEWVASEISNLSKEEGLKDGEYLKSVFFAHMPIGEYKLAHDELFDTVYDDKNSFAGYKASDEAPKNTEYVWGEWGEKAICIGGFKDETVKPQDKDRLFEKIGEEMNSMELYVCGHDHMNNAYVKYKGIGLLYGYSVDNEAYGTKIKWFGKQRGANVFSFRKDGTIDIKLKNAYTDYGVDANKFGKVDITGELYPDVARKP